MAGRHIKDKTFEYRTSLLFVFFILGISLIVYKLFFVQINHYDDYLALAQKQFSWYSVIEPKRGEIFGEDKDGNRIALAINQESYILYVNPREIENSDEVLSLLKKDIVFSDSEENIRVKINDSSRAYLVLGKEVSHDSKIKIEPLKLKGVYFKQYYKRVYPRDNLAATTIGFVGAGEDGLLEGKYGLEKFFEDNLTGRPGFLTSENEVLRLPEDGSNIITTIDPKLQGEVERILNESIKKNKAQGGTVVVMNPKNGEILALADFPDFNPNKYNLYSDFSVFRSKAVENYEPGSVMKAITIAAALNENKLTPDTTYNDKGYVKADGYTIKNYDEKGHGVISIRHGMEKSYNTVAMYAYSLLGRQAFLSYVKNFGFGEPVNIELPSESKGSINNLVSSDAKDVNFLTASFGQGISVTPVQLVRAFSAFANDGLMVSPNIVKRIEYPDGRVKNFSSEESETSLSQNTIEQVNSILISVMENGSGQPAKMKDYTLAGKTGTAQIPKVGVPGYEPDDFIQTFIGFGPVSSPEFLVLVKMVRPGLIGLRFAETTVVPIFRDVVNLLINYYNIPPDRSVPEQ